LGPFEVNIAIGRGWPTDAGVKRRRGVEPPRTPLPLSGLRADRALQLSHNGHLSALLAASPTDSTAFFLDLLYGEHFLWSYMVRSWENYDEIEVAELALKLRALSRTAAYHFRHKQAPPLSWIEAARHLGSTDIAVERIARRDGLDHLLAASITKRIWRDLFMVLEVSGATILEDQVEEFNIFKVVLSKTLRGLFGNAKSASENSTYVHNARGPQNSHISTQSHAHFGRSLIHEDGTSDSPQTDHDILHALPYINSRTISGDFIDAPAGAYVRILMEFAMLTREYVSNLRHCHHSSRKLYDATLHNPIEWLISPYHPDLASALEGLGSDVWSLATVFVSVPNRSTAEVLDKGRQTTTLRNYIRNLQNDRGASLRYGS
jgi:hypothetical protein